MCEWEFVWELLEREKPVWQDRASGLYQSIKTPPLSEPARERIRVVAADYGLTVSFEVLDGQLYLRTARPRKKKP